MTRIKIHLCDHDIEFFIGPMPSVPRKSDSIWINQMVGGLGLKENELEIIEKYVWTVDFVSWEKDESGFFAQLFCEGE